MDENIIMKKLKQSKKENKIFHYDRKADVFYIGIKSGWEEEYVEVAPGVNVEIGEKRKVIGVEILNASKILKLITRPLRGKEQLPRQPAFST